jgi:diguanylate cyclase
MVEILCTLVGVVSGVAIVAALMQHQNARTRVEANEKTLLPDEAASLKGITTQLQILTTRVAADVSAHTKKVVHINECLLPAPNEPERILTAITDLIQANESMQGQLEAAQERLSKQSEQIASTARQARTDALTGLSNRRALEETLKNCIDSIDQKQVVALVLLDIDHFKSFNDTYGHITGDAVLASFARSIMKWCNGRYYSARYGGEEFAIILTGESGSALACVAADARKFISEQVIAYEDLRLTITSSAGLTIIDEADTLSRVYERADEGLYRSKKAGRNCGHWLDLGEWKPFPGPNGLPLEPARKPAEETAQKPTGNIETPKGLPHATAPSEPEKSQASTGDSDVLGLSVFVERLDAQLKQLSRANMPAAAIMIEAVGLTPSSASDFDQSWSKVLEIVKLNLRGIDLICRLRQNTLCIFLPGCTLNAALEKAGGMQHLLEDRQTSDDEFDYPERFAIATGISLINETCGPFLQRLEDALEEAQDAGPFELVVCDDGSTYFQPT